MLGLPKFSTELPPGPVPLSQKKDPRSTAVSGCGRVRKKLTLLGDIK